MKENRPYARFMLFLSLTALLIINGYSQKIRKNEKTPVVQATALTFDETLYKGLEWRELGPFRGGRSAAVTGVSGKPNLFYFGATGGGIWRTRDGGSNWENISDGYFGGSIGAVAVSEYDPNVIYAGGGEVTVRGNVSSGDGMWKSLDAGKTWTHIGLENSRHIPRICIHPKNAEIVYAAVLGDLYKSSEERGVYRSSDGGKTWTRLLFANADAGAVDLVMNPSNPRVLFAATWRVRRTPYSLESGGEGSALWKSTDGGDTWKNISENKGLPPGTRGIIGVSISGANANRIYAIIEAADGGVFRSDDGGDTWQKLNTDRALRQRAWYYTRIYADPQDEEVVYVLNVSYHKSTDGGRTFKSYNAPHGDHHDMWIAPEDPNRIIMADDGGAQVSFDGGENWSTYHNQPTAQFYRVVTDDHFPFRIYGAQQDNSTVRILHRTDGYAITEHDWEETAGSESAHIAVDPTDNDIVYGGSYGGFLSRQNHRTGEVRAINVWPDNPMGYGAEGMRYRFQWNFPIFFSPHTPQKVYAGSNHLHVTTNEGQSWEVISPDLTRNDPTKLGPSGGPITKDNTGVEYYCTIFAAAESPYEPGLIWTGSDDGLVHLTRDGGKNWENVTPSIMPEWSMINSVEPDPFVKGGLYIAATLYKSGDFHPYLYKTKDYGKTWTKIVNGINEQHFTRVVRADPARKGLLYAGTETGMYISFDDGESWKPFQLNLPVVPITDLALKQNKLIAATQGRSFWIVDDLTPLHQLNESVAGSNFFLYQPLDTYRMPGGSSPRRSFQVGTNHPAGVMVHYYLKEKPADSVEVKLIFLEKEGKVIRTFSTKDKNSTLKTAAGSQRFVWNMLYEDAKTFDGMILWWGETDGPKAIPGEYRVRLVVGKDSVEKPFVILKDPRVGATPEDFRAQFDFLIKVRDKLSETHQAIMDIRKTRAQLNHISERIGKTETYAEIAERIKAADSAMTVIEETLYQTKNRSGQDPLNYPIRLNNKLAHLASLSGLGDFPPTQQSLDFLEEVSKSIDEQLEKWQQIRNTQLPEINRQVKDKQVDWIGGKAD
ncbi:MAG: glycosyl hydrolase [Bacteroidia bacterium]|nr:glycosyl hydrolase [Bacteroidia bacterium]